MSYPRFVSALSVLERGFHKVSSLQTEAKHGKPLPVITDSTLHSGGEGMAERETSSAYPWAQEFNRYEKGRLALCCRSDLFFKTPIVAKGLVSLTQCQKCA